MNLRLLAFRNYLRSSLWFIPTICVIFAFALAEVAIRIDRGLDRDGADWFLFSGDLESARSVVSTIAQSMLTFTGLVFTVTMLVLQLASNQLSPRVMRTFLRDRGNQVVLGVFIATYLYALLILRRISEGADSEPFVPALSVWLALLSVVVSIGLFIYYIHHMTQAIRPISVMASVARETLDTIDRLYPGGIAEPAAASEQDRLLKGTPVSAIVLSPGPSGVLTGIDKGLILKSVSESNTVELLANVGDFVRAGAPLFRVRGTWDGDGAQGLQEAVNFSAERTMEQDASFGLRQLVDIAIRALSPGINDPTTAVQAIDQIHQILARLITRGIPSPFRATEGERLAVLPRPSWADYVALACDEIRRSGEGQIQVQRRLRVMLLDLLTFGLSEDRRRPLEEQLRMLDAGVASNFHRLELERFAPASSQGQAATSEDELLRSWSSRELRSLSSSPEKPTDDEH